MGNFPTISAYELPTSALFPTIIFVASLLLLNKYVKYDHDRKLLRKE
jgi:hypothetical protein